MFSPIGVTLKIIAGPGFLVGATISTLLLALGHWFPWQAWLGQRLSRLGAYAYGAACLWLGFTIWRAWHNDFTTPLGLALIYLLGGLVVAGAYRFDAYILARARRRRHSLVNQHEQQKE